MTPNTQTLSVAPVWRAIVAAAGTGLDRVKTIVVAIRNRRELHTLAHFDERMLADIGLNRSDVRFALAEPFWRDPGLVLIARAQERPAIGPRRRPPGSLNPVAAPSIVPEPGEPAPTVARC